MRVALGEPSKDEIGLRLGLDKGRDYIGLGLVVGAKQTKNGSLAQLNGRWSQEYFINNSLRLRQSLRPCAAPHQLLHRKLCLFSIGKPIPIMVTMRVVNQFTILYASPPFNPQLIKVSPKLYIVQALQQSIATGKPK